MNAKVRFLSFLLTSSLLASCCLFYDTQMEEGQFSYCLNRKDKVAFVHQFDCQNESSDISIPNSVSGYRVTGIGGYYGRGAPTPFFVSGKKLPESIGADYEHCVSILCTEEEYEEVRKNQPDHCTDYVFHLTIGPNICYVYSYPDISYYEVNEEKYFIAIYFYIECSLENKTYFSREGKLYTKENHILVDDFLYQ